MDNPFKDMPLSQAQDHDMWPGITVVEKDGTLSITIKMEAEINLLKETVAELGPLGAEAFGSLLGERFSIDVQEIAMVAGHKAVAAL